MNLPCDAPNTSCLSATPTLTSANTALTSSTLAAFWWRKQRQQLSNVGASQALGSGHAGAPSSAAPACPGCPVCAQHERARHHPRSNGRTARLRRLATFPLARTSDTNYQLSPTQPMVQRSEMTSYPSEILAP